MAFQGVDPISFESVSNVTATNSVELGTRRVVDGNEYLYVYNAGGEQIDPGLGCTVSAVSGYSVTVSSTVSALVGLGVVKHATLTTGTYGWILTKGFANYESGGAVSVGEGLSLAGDGTWVNTSGITGPVYGKAMAATGSGGSATAYFSF